MTIKDQGKQVVIRCSPKIVLEQNERMSDSTTRLGCQLKHLRPLLNVRRMTFIPPVLAARALNEVERSPSPTIWKRDVANHIEPTVLRPFLGPLLERSHSTGLAEMRSNGRHFVGHRIAGSM